jgi:outer membrane protein insertion porin family
LRKVERNRIFMKSLRPLSLNSVRVCVCGLFAVGFVAGQATPPVTPAPQQSVSPPAPQQTVPPPTPPAPANPFETIPQADTPPKPASPIQQPQFEPPKPPENGQQIPLGADIIEGIQFRGARRVPQDTLRSLIFSRVGDVYNEDTLRRDFMALWNSNRLDDIRIETEKGERGGVVVTFVIQERPVIRDIKYEGAKSVSVSDILDRFKERKVGLTVESQYDPNVVNHAAVVLKELIAEHGHQFATVTPDLKRIPPSSLEVVFNVVEGPKIKVGDITILGNKAFSHREVVEAMKNLHGIGIPHSIFFENIFASTFDAAKLE